MFRPLWFEGSVTIIQRRQRLMYLNIALCAVLIAALAPQARAQSLPFPRPDTAMGTLWAETRKDRKL